MPLDGSEEARAASSELWRRVQKLVTDPQTFAALENSEFAAKMKPAVQNLTTTILGHIAAVFRDGAELVEPVVEGLDQLANAVKSDDLEDTFKSASYIRAISKLSRWSRAAEAYGAVEQVLAKDRALVKQFVASYKSCSTWEVAGLRASLVYDLECVTSIAEERLKQIACSDLRALKNQLTNKLKEVEPLFEKKKWKSQVGDSAPLKDVIDAAKRVLLQEGVGSSMQKTQKDLTKAASRIW